VRVNARIFTYRSPFLLAYHSTHSTKRRPFNNHGSEPRKVPIPPLRKYSLASHKSKTACVSTSNSADFLTLLRRSNHMSHTAFISGVNDHITVMRKRPNGMRGNVLEKHGQHTYPGRYRRRRCISKENGGTVTHEEMMEIGSLLSKLRNSTNSIDGEIVRKEANIELMRLCHHLESGKIDYSSQHENKDGPLYNTTPKLALMECCVLDVCHRPKEAISL